MRNRLPEAALLAATVAWGLSFVVVKWALADAGFVGLTVLRMSAGLLVLVVVGRTTLRGLTPAELRGGVLAGIALSGGYLLQTAGLRTATAAASGFLTAFYIALTPVFESLAFRRAPPRRDVVVLLLAAAGICTMVAEEELRFSSGEALVALSAFCWAAQIVIVGSYAPRVRVRRLAAVQLATVACVALLAFPFSGEPLPRATPTLLGCVAYLGAVTCALCFLIQAWGQRVVPPTRAATLYAGEPVFAAVFGVALLGERFDTTDLVGAGLVMAAVALTLRAHAPPPGAPAGREGPGRTLVP